MRQFAGRNCQLHSETIAGGGGGSNPYQNGWDASQSTALYKGMPFADLLESPGTGLNTQQQ